MFATFFILVLSLFYAFADRDGKSLVDDLTQYSCSRNLKLSSYVSRNNKNSSCEQLDHRGAPGLVQPIKDQSQCYCRSDNQGNFSNDEIGIYMSFLTCALDVSQNY